MAATEDSSADFPSAIYSQTPQPLIQPTIPAFAAPPEPPRTQWSAPPPQPAPPPKIDPLLQQKINQLEADRAELRNEVDIHRGKISGLERQMFMVLGKITQLEGVLQGMQTRTG
jgi:hypothetical protein